MRTIVWLVVLVIVAVAHATMYRFTVSRIGLDLYEVDKRDIVIRTKGCVDPVFAEDAWLNLSGGTGEIGFIGQYSMTFGSAKRVCIVDGAYEKVEFPAAPLAITVTYLLPDWYEALETEYLVRTTDCKALAQGESATLGWSPSGAAVLEFSSNDSCSVHGLYRALER